jgi:undecaprenyl-diphosphatase
VVLAAYLFFEIVVINHRPVLIEGQLEASYPSSTTMLVLCVMPTALMQLKPRLTGKRLYRCFRLLVIAFTVFMVVARLVSGVHWFSDIVGGMLLSTGLVQLYRSLTADLRPF